LNDGPDADLDGRQRIVDFLHADPTPAGRLVWALDPIVGRIAPGLDIVRASLSVAGL
jgi:hypothetical protein